MLLSIIRGIPTLVMAVELGYKGNGDSGGGRGREGNRGRINGIVRRARNRDILINPTILFIKICYRPR